MEQTVYLFSINNDCVGVMAIKTTELLSFSELNKTTKIV